MRQITKDQFDNILDCFTGADGGVRFVNLRAALEQFDKEAVEGNEDSAECLCVLSMFSKFIDYVQPEHGKRYRPDPTDPPFEFEPEEDDGSDEVLGEEKQT